MNLLRDLAFSHQNKIPTTVYLFIAASLCACCCLCAGCGGGGGGAKAGGDASVPAGGACLTTADCVKGIICVNKKCTALTAPVDGDVEQVDRDLAGTGNFRNAL